MTNQRSQFTALNTAAFTELNTDLFAKPPRFAATRQPSNAETIFSIVLGVGVIATLAFCTYYFWGVPFVTEGLCVLDFGVLCSAAGAAS